jgi:hypothetical protein
VFILANILGISHLDFHCLNAQDTNKLRTSAPNIVQTLLQWNENAGIERDEGKRPAEREEVGLLSLNEFLRTRLSKVTHETIAGLQAAQQDKLRRDLKLKETKK